MTTEPALVRREGDLELPRPFDSDPVIRERVRRVEVEDEE